MGRRSGGGLLGYQIGARELWHTGLPAVQLRHSTRSSSRRRLQAGCWAGVCLAGCLAACPTLGPRHSLVASPCAKRSQLQHTRRLLQPLSELVDGDGSIVHVNDKKLVAGGWVGGWGCWWNAMPECQLERAGVSCPAALHLWRDGGGWDVLRWCVCGGLLPRWVAVPICASVAVPASAPKT